jgi:serine/threonine-protein kinase
MTDAGEPKGWPGRVLGERYRVLRAVGHGGIGSVYEAEVLGGSPGAGGTSSARVAVKILDRQWSKDEVVAGRFAREARAASTVDSPHIVRVLDGGTAEGCPYLVMDLVEGEDLGARLHVRRHLELDETIGIAEQLLEGLVAAHAAGVVHRDLKPDNVLLTRRTARSGGRTSGPEDFVTIVDFGMSKLDRPKGTTKPLPLTRGGQALGTPFYMSPEQARASHDVDARSDLWAVGAIAFECLAGRPPFTGETHEQVMLKICMDEAPDVRRWAPETPDALAAVIARALEKEPQKRWASADTMLAAVRAIGRVGAGDVRRARRQARLRVAAAGVIAVIAGAVVTWLAVLLAGR